MSEAQQQQQQDEVEALRKALGEWLFIGERSLVEAVEGLRRELNGLRMQVSCMMDANARMHSRLLVDLEAKGRDVVDRETYASCVKYSEDYAKAYASILQLVKALDAAPETPQTELVRACFYAAQNFDNYAEHHRREAEQEADEERRTERLLRAGQNDHHAFCMRRALSARDAP